MHQFRHYIYGIKSGEEDYFLTTTLNVEGAEAYIESHKNVFKGRFDSYSIRITDKVLKDVK